MQMHPLSIKTDALHKELKGKSNTVLGFGSGNWSRVEQMTTNLAEQEYTWK